MDDKKVFKRANSRVEIAIKFSFNGAFRKVDREDVCREYSHR